MRAINVWAWQQGLSSIPGYERVPVCSDASAAATAMGSASVPWLRDQGWHIALSFTDLDDLADKLSSLDLPGHIHGEPRRLQRGEVQNLAIDCHGSAGRFYPNGVARDRAVTARNLDDYGEALRGIGLMTASAPHPATNPLQRAPFVDPPSEHPASTILLVACNSAAGRSGTQLLVRLSFRWPGRTVAGFSTTVVFPHLTGRATDSLSGEACVPPFALDSGLHHVESGWVEEELLASGMTPAHLPFANVTAANAKLARDGQIIATPANERVVREGRGASLTGPPRGVLTRPTYGPQAVRMRA